MKVKENQVQIVIRPGTVIKATVIACTTYSVLKQLNWITGRVFGPPALKRAELLRERAETWNEALKEKEPS